MMKQMEWEQFQMFFAILAANDANASQIYSFEAVGVRRSSSVGGKRGVLS